MAITKAEFLSNGPKVETFKHPNGSEIVVRQLNELERAKYFARFTAADGDIDKVSYEEKRSSALICMSVLNPDGSLMFSEDDEPEIQGLGGAFTFPIYGFLVDLNAFYAEGLRQARKNSEEATA